MLKSIEDEVPDILEEVLAVDKNNGTIKMRPYVYRFGKWMTEDAIRNVIKDGGFTHWAYVSELIA